MVAVLLLSMLKEQGEGLRKGEGLGQAVPDAHQEQQQGLHGTRREGAVVSGSLLRG